MADFSANFDFSPAKIARNRPIVPPILTFFPRKSRKIGRFFREFAPENPAKFCLFFREISEALQRVFSLSSMLCGSLSLLPEEKLQEKSLRDQGTFFNSFNINIVHMSSLLFWSINSHFCTNIHTCSSFPL